jgi:hypothetical protein
VAAICGAEEGLDGVEAVLERLDSACRTKMRGIALALADLRAHRIQQAALRSTIDSGSDEFDDFDMFGLREAQGETDFNLISTSTRTRTQNLTCFGRRRGGRSAQIFSCWRGSRRSVGRTLKRGESGRSRIREVGGGDAVAVL